jgi:hypothetical protein
VQTSENNRTERFEAFLATLTALTVGRQTSSMAGGINIGIGWPALLIGLAGFLLIAWIIGRRRI